MTLVYEEKTKKIVNVLMIFITIIEFSLPILIFVYQQVKQSKLYIKKYFTICTLSSLIIKFFYKQQHKIKTYFVTYSFDKAGPTSFFRPGPGLSDIFCISTTFWGILANF